MLLCRNIGECGGIFNLDGHAQIKKCPHVPGVLHASVVSLAWPLHKRMTRTFCMAQEIGGPLLPWVFPPLGARSNISQKRGF